MSDELDQHLAKLTAASAPGVANETSAETVARLTLTPASNVTMQRQRWLWADRIPMDTPSIFAGRGGEGKTTFALDLAAKLTRGELPGEYEGEPSTVLIWSGEDRAETVLVPRLTAASADLDRVTIITGVGGGENSTSTPKFPEHLAALADAITETGARLVILDPFTSTTTGDLHKVADVRQSLDGLAEVTHSTEAVVLGIMHFNKGAGIAGDKLSGSHAFRDAVRSLFLFATDEEHDSKVVTQEKNNYAPNTSPSLAFGLVSTPIETSDGVVHVARVEHFGDSPVSVQDIIGRQPEGEKDRSERQDAEQWLHGFLTQEQYAGTALATVIRDAAREYGFSERTIQRAGKTLCIKRRDGYQGSYSWTLRDLTELANDANEPPTMPTVPTTPTSIGTGNIGKVAKVGNIESSTCETCDPLTSTMQDAESTTHSQSTAANSH